MKNYLFILLLLVCGKAFSQKIVNLTCLDAGKSSVSSNGDFYRAIDKLAETGGELVIECDLTLSHISDDHVTKFNCVKSFEYKEITIDEEGKEKTTDRDYFYIDIPDNIDLRFEAGGSLNLISGTNCRVRINGNILAPKRKIFKGNSGAITGSSLLEVFPEWWGAVANDNVNDKFDIINAINFYKISFPFPKLVNKIEYNVLVNENKPGIVKFSNGTYLTNGSIELKDYITLKGEKSEDGWVRTENFNVGSRIKLMDNSNTDVILIKDAADRWGLENLIIDGNKENQTLAGSHCVKLDAKRHTVQPTNDSPQDRSFGGVIKGCLLVNPVEFAYYGINSQSMNITETSFMSGIFITNSADVNITACNLDGTNGKHPALYLNKVDSCNLSNNFTWGWGEQLKGLGREINDGIYTGPDNRHLYKEISISYSASSNEFLYQNDYTNTATIEKDEKKYSYNTDYKLRLYNDMPVTLKLTDNTTSNHFYIKKTLSDNTVDYEILNDNDTFFLYNEGTEKTKWSLWDKPKGSKASHRVYRNVDGNFILSYGDKSTALITNSKSVSLTSNRFASSVNSGMTCNNSKNIIINNNMFWRMNTERKDNIAALTLIDAKYCQVNGNTLGENSFSPENTHIDSATKSNIDYGILLKRGSDNTGESNNIIGVNNFNIVKKSFIKNELPRLTKYTTTTPGVKFENFSFQNLKEDKESDEVDNFFLDYINTKSTTNVIPLKYTSNNIINIEPTKTRHIELRFNENEICEIKGQIALRFPEICPPNVVLNCENTNYDNYYGEAMIRLFVIQADDINATNPKTLLDRSFVAKINPELAGKTFYNPITIPFETIVTRNNVEKGKFLLLILQMNHTVKEKYLEFDKQERFSWLTVKYF